MILGPLMEVKLREALDLSGGEISGLFNEPLAIFCYLLIVVILVAPVVLRRFRSPARGPRGEGGGPMTVVVGYIPDKYGEAALAAGIEEARRRGAGLVVVNATKGDALVDRRYVGEEGLAELESRLAGLDVEHEVRQAMGADIADEMLRVVDDTQAQVLVIGIRHRSPVGKMIMGSVAQQVLLDAPCPVLAVKPPA